MPRARNPDSNPSEPTPTPTPTPNDVELCIDVDVDVDEFWDNDDVETTTRIPADESQRLVDAAFGPPR